MGSDVCATIQAWKLNDRIFVDDRFEMLPEPSTLEVELRQATKGFPYSPNTLAGRVLPWRMNEDSEAWSAFESVAQLTGLSFKLVRGRTLQLREVLQLPADGW